MTDSKSAVVMGLPTLSRKESKMYDRSLTVKCIKKTIVSIN